MILHIKSNILLLLSSIIFFSCAAQGPATGGPKDKKGLEIIHIEPSNQSLQLENDTQITIYFDEMVDPVSVPSSVIIENQTYRVKIRSRKIIIIPEDEWKSESIIRVDISRNIRDYQGNNMHSPYQFIFSTGEKIPRGRIDGTVINADTNKVILAGLFEYPLLDSAKLIRKTECSTFGNFSFDYVKPGNYFVVCVEGNLENVLSSIRQFRYAMMSQTNISVDENNTLNPLTMMLHNPIEHKQIQSIDLMNQTYGVAELTDGTQLKTLLVTINNEPYNVGDSVTITHTLENSVEKYTTNPFQFIMPKITDTLPPEIKSSIIENEDLTIEFNEPVHFLNSQIYGLVDSNKYELLLSNNTPLTAKVIDIPDSISAIEFEAHTISDYYSNLFPDSTISVSVSRNQNQSESIIGGNILGSIELETQSKIGIEAINDETKISYFTSAVNGTFKLENLPSGFYSVWAFEKLNRLNPSTYFPGTFEPYHRASKFVKLPDLVEVRARWDIEGIHLQFENKIEGK